MVHVKHRTVLVRIQFRGLGAAAQGRIPIDKHALIQAVKHQAGVMLGEIGQARHASALSISYLNSETGFVVITTKRGFEAELIKVLESIKEFERHHLHHQPTNFELSRHAVQKQNKRQPMKPSSNTLHATVKVESVHGTIKQAMRKITKVSRDSVRLRMRRAKTPTQLQALLKAYKAR